jgi:trehalose 6-phosphate synthase
VSVLAAFSDRRRQLGGRVYPLVVVSGGLPGWDEVRGVPLGVDGRPDDPVTTGLASVRARRRGAWVGLHRDMASRAGVGAPAVPSGQTLDRVLVDSPRYRQAYRRSNVALAVAAAELAAYGGSVWVQAPTLELVPGVLRRLRPDLRIGIHVRNTALAGEAPCGSPIYRDTVDSLLGADLVGFQTAQGAEAFLRARYAVRSRRGPVAGAPTAEVGVFPTSVDAAHIRLLAADADIQRRARCMRETAGDGSPIVLYAGHSPGDPLGRAPDDTPGWLAALRTAGDARVLRWDGGATLAERVTSYLAADVLVAVQPDEAAHLAALEFAAAARPAGALVLGRGSAAAAMLPQAFVVEPGPAGQQPAAIGAALMLDADERAARMAAMRRFVTGYDTYAWARSFMIALQPDAVPDWMVEKDPKSSDWVLNDRFVPPRARNWRADRLRG